MLLPFWTDGCIGSMEGLYFEASATTPFHFLNQDELSTAPSNAPARPALRAGPPTAEQFDPGVQHLQMMGVKYYMAISDGMIALGRANPSLTEVAASGPWVVFEVADSELVEPLDNQPAVLTDVEAPRAGSTPSTPWYLDPGQWDVYLGRRRARRRGSASTPDDVPTEVAGRPRSRSPTSRRATTRIEFDVERGRPTGAGEGVVLPELAGRRGRGPLPGGARTSWSWCPPTPTSSCTTGTPPSTTSAGSSPCSAWSAWSSWSAAGRSTCPSPRPWFAAREPVGAARRRRPARRRPDGGGGGGGPDAAPVPTAIAAGASGDGGRFDPTAVILGEPRPRADPAAPVRAARGRPGRPVRAGRPMPCRRRRARPGRAGPMAHDRLALHRAWPSPSQPSSPRWRLARWMRGPLAAARRPRASPAPRCGPRRPCASPSSCPPTSRQDRIGDTVARLQAALDTLAADGGLEVVVVDDGSTDDTADAGRGRRRRPGRRPPREPGQGRRGARRACWPPAAAPSPSPTPTWPTPPTSSPALLDAGRGGLGRRRRQPPPHRHHHPRAGPAPARGRRPGHQPAHPGRAARPATATPSAG